jgi:hypothetical protein
MKSAKKPGSASKTGGRTKVKAIGSEAGGNPQEVRKFTLNLLRIGQKEVQ